MSQRLVDSLGTTEPLSEVFSDSALLAAMLRFEGALARAESHLGVIPVAAADAIARAAMPAAFDAAAIAREAHKTGTIAVPLVDALIARVAAVDPAASTFVHWGATSQDVTDTALALCLARALPILQSDHERLTSALRQLSNQHAETIMLGRTLLQPAPPITFGLKAAGWFAAVSRSGAQMMAAGQSACVLQLGGATGTLAALGPHGLAVASELARELELQDPGGPWHAHRDRLASLVTACGVYCGTLAKIARDVTLLMQYEVAEATEPGGGSSTMPHKQNPVACGRVLAAAARMPGLVGTFLAAMTHEHERGVSVWATEAPTLVAVVQVTGAALAAVREVVGTLRVDADRMRHNLTATRGVIFAERAMMLLAPPLGREAARRIIAAALDTTRVSGQPFPAAVAANAEAAAVLTPAELASLGSPEAYLGAADELRRRLLGEE